MSINSKLPVEMNMSIASVNEAIEYWLQNVVFKEDVKIEKVEFLQHPDYMFRITLDRKDEE